MELIGKHDGGVSSMSCSHSSPFVFVSCGEDDRIRLWDTRAKRRQIMSLGGDPAGLALTDMSEILLDHDSTRFNVITVCGNQLVAVDVRRPFGLSRTPLELPTDGEGISFIIDNRSAARGIVTQGGWELIAADDNGVLHQVDAAAWTLRDAAIGGYGNLCCGLSLTSSNHMMWSVSMGGHIQGFTLPMFPSFGGLALTTEGNVLDLRPRDGEQRSQLHNPPIPTCVGAMDAQISVGRGDGTYSIYDIAPETDNIEEVLCAPGHQSNGLVFTDWAGNERPMLLTVALSGEITGWDVQSFLATDPDDTAGELPSVVFAEAIRDEKRLKNVVNCCHLSQHFNNCHLFVGDDEGCVFGMPILAAV